MKTGDFNAEKIEKIKAKANIIQKEAMKYERMLGNIKSHSEKGLEKIAKVDDLIISSIKAKLAILEQVQ